MAESGPTEGWWTREQRELVEDASIAWRTAEFAPRDAWRVPFSDSHAFVPYETYADPATRPEGCELVAGGWDHEHCALCWEKIMAEPHGQPEGYTDGKHRWLCFACFERFVAPRRIQR